MTRADLLAALRGLVVVNLPASDAVQTHWFCLIEDRREQGAARFFSGQMFSPIS